MSVYFARNLKHAKLEILYTCASIWNKNNLKSWIKNKHICSLVNHANTHTHTHEMTTFTGLASEMLSEHSCSGRHHDGTILVPGSSPGLLTLIPVFDSLLPLFLPLFLPAFPAFRSVSLIMDCNYFHNVVVCLHCVFKCIYIYI